MIDIRTLRAAGLTDAQIVKVLEEDQAKRREENRKSQINHRARQHEGGLPADRGVLTTSLDRPTISQEKKVEIVAPAYPAAFLQFYAVYPRKAEKLAALKAWRKVIAKGVSNEALIAGAERYAADPNRDPSFTKHPATWLTAGCHEDEPLPKRGGQNGQGRRHGSVLDAFDRLGEKLKAAGASDDYIPGSSGPRPLQLDQEVRPTGLKLVPKR